MTLTELDRIEQTLGFPLPQDYRAVMLDYPFGHDITSDDMLSIRPEKVVDPRLRGFGMEDIAKPFFIGSDGSEEVYLMDGARSPSPVYVFDLETGKVRVLCATLNDYLTHIRRVLKEIEEEEVRMRIRHANRKWWEFWK